MTDPTAHTPEEMERLHAASIIELRDKFAPMIGTVNTSPQKAVMVNGVRYESVLEASTALNVPQQAVQAAAQGKKNVKGYAAKGGKFKFKIVELVARYL